MRVKTKHGFRKFVFPRQCSCCLEPTNEDKEIKYTIKEGFGATVTSKTYSIHVPLCGQCKAHQNHGVFAVILIMAVAIILFAIIPIMFPKDVVVSVLRITGLLFFLVPTLLILLYFNYWWPKRHPGHAKVGKPIKCVLDTDSATFVFFNDEYGQMFIDANRDSIIE